MSIASIPYAAFCLTLVVSSSEKNCFRPARTMAGSSMMAILIMGLGAWLASAASVGSAVGNEAFIVLPAQRRCLSARCPDCAGDVRHHRGVVPGCDALARCPRRSKRRSLLSERARKVAAQRGNRPARLPPDLA